MSINVGKKDKVPVEGQAIGRTNYRLSSSMSNEFRVLINEILGMNAMLLKECETPEMKEFAINIQDAGRNLLSLVNDVKDFSKIESGEMVYAPVNYDLFLTLNECYNMYATRIQEKNLEFNFKIDSSLPVELYGDEKRVRQIINSLLFFAVRFTKKGFVTLEVTFDRIADGSRDMIDLVIIVKDSGDGIPREAMEHLFDISERIEQLRDIERTDLGLNLVKRLVDLQGGTIQVDSDFGRGTSFKITIPTLVKKEVLMGDFWSRQKTYASSVKTEMSRFHAPKVRILVADELPTNLRVMKGFLKDTGITIDESSNGMDALEKIKRTQYHLIFLDKGMPVMNAEETLDILKTLAGNFNRNTPVVLMAAEDENISASECQKIGFADCLLKPVREESLFALFNRFIPTNLIESLGYAESAVKTKMASKNTSADVPGATSQEFDAKTLLALIQESKIPSDLLKLSASGFVDVNVGLNFCQNDEDLYRNLLSDFRKLNREETLDAAMDNEDFELYRIEIRSLKSAALTIGAVDMASRAKAMEFACKDGHYDYVQMHHEDFIRDYNHLMSALNESL
ncbi:MAG: ATP-binding protein [Fibrobacter sp.]|nr:ATP-binding protein [Fibrobacter sp.]